jgi:uncharacterized protein YggL (DUF469 family)
MTAPCPSFGFIATIVLAPGVDDSARAQFWREWLEFLEARGLYSGGGGGDSPEYVVASEAAQATDADREAVRAWLAGRRELSRFSVGELIDLSQVV